MSGTIKLSNVQVDTVLSAIRSVQRGRPAANVFLRDVLDNGDVMGIVVCNRSARHRGQIAYKLDNATTPNDVTRAIGLAMALKVDLNHPDFADALTEATTRTTRLAEHRGQKIDPKATKRLLAAIEAAPEEWSKLIADALHDNDDNG
jgi:hypothetical protein